MTDPLERIRNVLIADRSRALPQRVLPVLEHDLAAVLGAYFDTASIAAALEIDADGVLHLRVDAVVREIRDFRTAVPDAP